MTTVPTGVLTGHSAHTPVCFYAAPDRCRSQHLARVYGFEWRVALLRIFASASCDKLCGPQRMSREKKRHQPRATRSCCRLRSKHPLPSQQRPRKTTPLPSLHQKPLHLRLAAHRRASSYCNEQGETCRLSPAFCSIPKTGMLPQDGCSVISDTRVHQMLIRLETR